MTAPAAEVPAEAINRRSFLRRTTGQIASAGLATLGYAYLWEPHWIQVTRRGLEFENLPENLAGRVLVQISDLHVGRNVDYGYISHAVARVSEFQPDMLVITGDFMTCQGSEQIDNLYQVLKKLPQVRFGCFATLGNHDYTESHNSSRVAEELCERLLNLDIQVLRNSVTQVEGLQVAGIDDYYAGRTDVPATIKLLDPTRPSLALCHNPDIVDLAGWEGFQGWILAGHTHGGQCKAPFLNPPILPVRNKLYCAGEIELTGKRRMYINRGLGHMWQVRFNCRPEITVFTLHNSSTPELASTTFTRSGLFKAAIQS